MAEDVAVFLDFQNVHLTGHHLYGQGIEPYEWCHYLDETDWLATTDDWQGRV